MLDATTGAILRRIGVPAPPSRLAVDERTGRVFANTGQVLDARTGALIGHVAPGADVAVDAGSGRLFTVDGARLLIRDDATGRLLSTVPIADAQAVVADTRHHRAVVGIVPSDDEYFNEDTAIVDTRTGHVVAGATGAHGDVWAVDGRAGRAIAVSTFTSNETGSPISADIIDTRAGRVVRHIDLGASLRPDVVIGVDEQHGNAVVVMSCCAPWLRNVAYVIGMRDGRIPRQVVLGGGPPAIAVDAATGHVYVANLRDNTVSVLDTTHL